METSTLQTSKAWWHESLHLCCVLNQKSTFSPKANQNKWFHQLYQPILQQNQQAE